MEMTSISSQWADRDARQRAIIPPPQLRSCRALVIGVGAIGRQVAIQLAAIGISRLDLVDPDTVNIENLAPQAYFPQDLGQPKATATAQLCRTIYPEIQLETYPERFRRSSVKTLPFTEDPDQRTAVFCCVDDMEVRKLIWESLRQQIRFFADGRMAAEVVRVLASDQPALDAHYSATLFGQSQAYIGSCTAKSTVYAASIAAGLMLSQFTRWLRGLPVDRDVLLNLLSMEMTAG